MGRIKSKTVWHLWNRKDSPYWWVWRYDPEDPKKRIRKATSKKKSEYTREQLLKIINKVQGITGIEKTKNPARCEVVGKNPYIVIDGAQNRDSARALKETVKRNFKYKKLFLILGISKNKDIAGICDELIPLADTVILTKAKIERAEDPRVIKRYVIPAKAGIHSLDPRFRGDDIILTNSVKEAMDKARKAARDEDMILVTGSFYVAGEI